VDVVLYDTFAQPESDEAEIEVLVKTPHAGRVAVYTWTFHPTWSGRPRGWLPAATCPRRCLLESS
jgi:hypothetical protein